MHFHLSLLQQAMCESKQNVQGDSSSFVRVLSVAHTRRVTARESVTPCHTLTSQNSHSEFGQAFNPLSCLPWVGSKLLKGSWVLWNAAAWDACGTQSLSPALTTAEGRADTMTGVALVKLSMRLLVKTQCCPNRSAGKGCQSCQFQNFALTKMKGKKNQQPNVAAVIKC